MVFRKDPVPRDVSSMLVALLILKRAMGFKNPHFVIEATQDSSVTQPPNKILDSRMKLGSGRALKITTPTEFPINLVSEGLRIKFNLT